MEATETTIPEQSPHGDASQLKPWQFQPGQSGNPAGRPKGSSSIRDSIRKYLEDNPEEMTKLIKRFIERNPEFMWQMMEGAPPKAVVVGNLDGSNINTIAPAEVLKLAAQMNEIHRTASERGDGALPGPVGGEARAQDE